MPRFTLKVNVFVDKDTGEHYRSMVGDGNWSKISDPFWMIKNPNEKSEAVGIARLEKEQSDEKIRKEYLAHRAVNPNSCESVYYGLFTDGTNPKSTFSFEGENLADDFAFKQSTYNNNLRAVTGFYDMSPKERKELKSDFENLKKSFITTFSNEPSILAKKDLVAEIEKRASSAQFYISPNSDSGFIDPITDCRTLDLPCVRPTQVGLTADGFPLYNSDPATHVYVGLGIRKLLKMRSPASRVWYLGHELSHSSDTASPEVVACLTHNLDLRKTPKQDIESIVQGYKSVTPQGAGSDAYFGQGTEYAAALRKKLLAEKRLKRCKESGAKCSAQDRIAIENDVKMAAAALDSVSRRTQLFAELSSMRINRLLVKDDLFMERIRLINNSSDTLKEKKTLPVMAKIEKGYLHSQSDETEYDHDTYIQQYTEAIADYRANPGFIKYLFDKYPNDPTARRNAVLALLFTFKPSPFEGDDLAKMNVVGVKKMNETRVLKGILASKAIQNILGCQFERPQEIPADCSDPNVLAGFQVRGHTPIGQRVLIAR